MQSQWWWDFALSQTFKRRPFWLICFFFEISDAKSVGFVLSLYFYISLMASFLRTCYLSGGRMLFCHEFSKDSQFGYFAFFMRRQKWTVFLYNKISLMAGFVWLHDLSGGGILLCYEHSKDVCFGYFAFFMRFQR